MHQSNSKIDTITVNQESFSTGVATQIVSCSTSVDERGLFEEILKRLEEICHAENDLPTKTKKIQDLLEIPEKSAKKLLMSHI